MVENNFGTNLILCTFLGGRKKTLLGFTWRAVQASNEVVNLFSGLVQVDFAQLGLVQERVVSGAFFRLSNFGRFFLRNQVDGLSHGLDALGIHEPVIQAIHGVILSHWTLSL